MTKEQMTAWLENIVTAEKENPFGDGKVAVFSMDVMLKAADLLSDLNGWKKNYCLKQHSVGGPR